MVLEQGTGAGRHGVRIVWRMGGEELEARRHGETKSNCFRGGKKKMEAKIACMPKDMMWGENQVKNAEC